jgi:hypothetical protein
MCLFVALVLPSYARIRDLEQVFESRLVAFENDSLREQLPPEDLVVRESRKSCDCGTELGAGFDEPERPTLEKDLRRLRRKGWSQAKIEKWLANKSRASSARSRAVQGHAERNGLSAEIWVRRIRVALEGNSTRRLGLVLHDYEQAVSSESVSLVGKKRVRLDELSVECLLGMERDRLYEFVS